MAAYAAALSAIFPGRVVEAALLYTAGPAMIALPAERLAAAWRRERAAAEEASVVIDAPAEPQARL